MRTRTAAVALLVLASGACAGNPGVGEPVVGFDYTEIVVENGTPNNLRLFMLAGSAETPIGRVDALSHRVVRIPGYIAPVIRLVARPSVDHMGAAGEPGHLRRAAHVVHQDHGVQRTLLK
jgi:hypothetical protein